MLVLKATQLSLHRTKYTCIWKGQLLLGRKTYIMKTKEPAKELIEKYKSRGGYNKYKKTQCNLWNAIKPITIGILGVIFYYI